MATKRKAAKKPSTKKPARGSGPSSSPCAGEPRQCQRLAGDAIHVRPEASPPRQTLTESPVEDVRLSNIRIHYNGGGTKVNAVREIPENEKNYPEPSMFGTLPAYGFFIRHARGIVLSNIEVSYLTDELRPAFVLDDVQGADFFRIKTQKAQNTPTFVLKNVEDFSVMQSRPVADTRIERTEQKKF